MPEATIMRELLKTPAMAPAAELVKVKLLLPKVKLPLDKVNTLLIVNGASKVAPNELFTFKSKMVVVIVTF